MICGEAGHKKRESAPRFTHSTPTNQDRNWETCDGCTGKGVVSLAFLGL